MEKNDKQINEKQIHSCSVLSHARPNTRQGELYSQGFPALKSDSFHNDLSSLVIESCAHTKETQIRETCSGKTERGILLFHAYLTGKVNAGKAWLKSWANKEKHASIHPSLHIALYKIVTWLNRAQFSHILKIPSFHSASFWHLFFPKVSPYLQFPFTDKLIFPPSTFPFCFFKNTNSTNKVKIHCDSLP